MRILLGIALFPIVSNIRFSGRIWSKQKLVIPRCIWWILKPFVRYCKRLLVLLIWPGIEPNNQCDVNLSSCWNDSFLRVLLLIFFVLISIAAENAYKWIKIYNQLTQYKNLLYTFRTIWKLRKKLNYKIHSSKLSVPLIF